MSILCWFFGHKVLSETSREGAFSERWNGHRTYHGTCERCKKRVWRIFVWTPIGCNGSDWEVEVSK
jgi:hypothetical protein